MPINHYTKHMKLNKFTALLATIFLALNLSAATVDTVVIKTKLLPEPMHVLAITPDAAGAAKHCPTVYLLNGYGGDHLSWITLRPDLPRLADLYEVVIIAPDGMDSWYWDAPANPKMKMETFFTTELVKYVDEHFPTIKDPAQRAITGLSMGGHGALWLAMRHPDIWKNCGSTSGGVDITPFTQRWKIPLALGKTPSAKTIASHSVTTLAKSLKPGANNIIFDCGSSDFFHKVNATLHTILLNAKIPHDYISRPGGHSQTYWANSILYQLLYFDRCFNAAKK